MTGGEAGSVITIVKFLFADPAEFVALTLKLNEPVTDGVPDITPVVVLSDSPFGRFPEMMAQLIGVVPVAARVVV